MGDYWSDEACRQLAKGRKARSPDLHSAPAPATSADRRQIRSRRLRFIRWPDRPALTNSI